MRTAKSTKVNGCLKSFVTWKFFKPTRSTPLTLYLYFQQNNAISMHTGVCNMYTTKCGVCIWTDSQERGLGPLHVWVVICKLLTSDFFGPIYSILTKIIATPILLCYVIPRGLLSETKMASCIECTHRSCILCGWGCRVRGGLYPPTS